MAILLTVYVIITIVFFLLLLLSVFLGGDMDVDLDLDGGGMSPVSLPVISVFMVTLGAMGTILTYSGVHPALTPLISMVTAGIVSGIAFWIILNVFVKTQANTVVRKSDLLGNDAEVSISIKSDRPGQIMVVTQARGRVNYTAYADGEIATGTPVRIKEKRGDGFLVEGL